MKNFVLFFCCILLSLTLDAQYNLEKRTGEAVYTDNPPKIDGRLDDQCWTISNRFTDFLQYEPYSGIPSKQKTVAWIVYDDEGIYVGAMLYDTHPDSIKTQLGPRDGDTDIIAEYFNVDFGPYNDDLNAFSFKLAASGIQSDIKRSTGAGGRDLNWDAVWHSATQVVDSGWIAEIKIPFSAIRFPREGNKAWGFNLWRYIQRYGEWSSWNFADKSHGSTVNHLGELTGITNVKPPVRVSVTPYVSAYAENISNEKKWNNTMHFGADLKIGLSEAFTLDATLIPDFNQVQSDDVILNLTPYEVEYNEKRQFFTEGTDVFDKAGIFYSRRIGSTPSGYNDVDGLINENETIVSNPSETNLINATKISGRTKNGLGIGFFNAITEKTKAVISNTEDDSSREIVTQPLTNYNIFVVDQNLGSGSSLSLINTNVLHSGPDTGHDYTANVTAFDGRYLSEDRSYSLQSIISVSQKYYSDRDDIFGHSIYLNGGKTGGKIRYYYTLNALTDDYDPNDMGYLRRNNEFKNALTLGYSIYQPFGKIMRTLNTLAFQNEMQNIPRKYSNFSINLQSATTLINFMVFDLSLKINPIGSNDYYEPRVTGRYYSIPPSAEITAKYSTDTRKLFAITFSGRYKHYYTDLGMENYTFGITPVFHLNNNFKINHSFTYTKKNNDIGFSGLTPESIIFGKRNSSTIENILTLNYIQSAKAYFEFRLRHYWSKADYDSYYLLNEDGSLSDQIADQGNDINTNYFNIDMSYTWRFAPGSEISLVWKNYIYQSSSEIFHNLKENFNAMLAEPAVNSFSLKILYYLDYHSVVSR